MAKKVLFIAPSSFPVNSPEAIVNIKLLELLSNNGYEIDLISKKIKWSNYPSDQSLDELNVKVRKNIVVEVDNTLNLRTLWQHFYVYLVFGIVFKGAHWALEVLKNKSFFENTEYEYVITKDSPSFLLGYYLKKKYGLKWIATWNDPYPSVKYPFPYGQGLNGKLPFYSNRIIKLMKQADKHIFPNLRLKNYMLKYLNVDEGKTLVIPHLASAKTNVKKSSSNDLRFVHSGNVRSPRDPKPIVKAFLQFVSEGSCRGDVRLDFIGVFDDELKKMVLELDHNNQINLLAPVDYKKSLDMLRDYDVALIIEAPCEEGIFLPTKVGDYMSNNTPIFSISPSVGILKDLYDKNYVQYFADVGNSDEIFNEFSKIYDDFKKGKLFKSNFLEEYNGENILKLYNLL
ncbi:MULTISPECIES: hypothetical protein [Sphingobacterium]|uniref:hypothetical protein n=1 Tax=Sphingobacterium TaxID=28453 RepID=UPI002580A43B|nr:MULTISPECIES: hypothetical protein [Sphingobacterium]